MRNFSHPIQKCEFFNINSFIVHLNILTLEVLAIGGYKYQLTILVGDENYLPMLKSLRIKADAGEAFKMTTMFIEKQTGKPIQTIQTDSAGELSGPNSAIGEFCSEQGIHIRISAPFEHEQNRRVERYNHISQEGVWACLLSGNFAKRFWHKAFEFYDYAYTNSFHKKKKKKIGGLRYNLSEFPIFCYSVYLCGWLPQKIL